MSDITKQILKWVKEVDTIKRENKECASLLTIINSSSDKIGQLYPKIHNEEYSSTEEMNNIMMEISILAEDKRVAEKKYKEIMSEGFKEFKSKYENIYELAVSEDGIDMKTLNNVLRVFELCHEKKISETQGINRGIDYMKSHFNLPNDFLNYLPE